jgi:hypothetical protein
MYAFKQAARRLLGHQRYRMAKLLLQGGEATGVSGSRPIVGPMETSALIRSMLFGGGPYAIGKVGATELRALTEFWDVTRGQRRSARNGVIQELHVVSGVFPPTNQMLIRFAEYFSHIVEEMNVLVAWGRPGESTLLGAHGARARLISMEGLDPFYVDQPWTAALAGKTVLVASPFVDSIARQYERRSLVWPDREELLPAFRLELMRLPFSDGLVKSPFDDWFQALGSLRADLSSRLFDVLLVGGGAFSLPLTVAAKQIGKVGIHLGGSTQILFGIRGARWDDHPATSRFFNEYWVRPSRFETPEGYRKVEAGSYW